MSHYHIHWSSKDTLDWESFRSLAEAERTARQFVRPGETYTIEERDDEACPRCRAAFKRVFDTGEAVSGNTKAKAAGAAERKTDIA
jgi:hypothetical protein